MNTPKAFLLTVCLAAAPMVNAADKSVDPYEPYNRVMFKFNDTADRYVLAPVARGYRKITPQPIRTGVSNFFNNLRDVVSFGSNLLRLDIKRASEDFIRVGVNTTFGLGGLINIADAGGIPNNKNTLGDTFASWGWKNSNYFVYPLLGPSTVRDSLGETILMAYPVDNPLFKNSTAARYSVKALRAVNTREGLLDLTDGLDQAALDRYSYMRDMYMRLRTQQVGGTLPNAEENINIDDLVNEEAGNSPSAPPAPASQLTPTSEAVPALAATVEPPEPVSTTEATAPTLDDGADVPIEIGYDLPLKIDEPASPVITSETAPTF